MKSQFINEKFFILLVPMISNVMGVRFEDLKFEKGDTVMFPFIHFAGRYTPFLAPYHKMFAISGKELLHVVKIKGMSIFRITSPSKFKRGTRLGPALVVKPDMRRNPVIEKGVVLAYRIQGVWDYPYNLLSCNCQHWTDYLTYGRTFGRKSNPSYLPMSDDCPLAREITANTDVTAPDFKLWAKNEKEYALKETPPMFLEPVSTLKLYAKVCIKIEENASVFDSDNGSDIDCRLGE